MRKVLVKEYLAMGGPARRGMGGDGYPAGPTESGPYRVAYWGKHKSARYPAWSSVRWGTPLRKRAGQLEVQVDGRWRPLADFTSVTEEDILSKYQGLYDVRRLPDAWVFNDFGHLTLYLYRDLNSNQRFDRGHEVIHGEFLHSTPENEAEFARGADIEMVESHGCVHVQPHHIDELIRNGYVKRNTYVFVHHYGERVIRFPRGMRPRRPFEIHIYPGVMRLCVIGVE